MMHSARREIGTHTSVDTARAPGCSCRQAKYASWRACQSLLRSSGLVAHWKSSPPCSVGDLLHHLGLLRDAASVPWNSRNSVG